MTRGQTTPRFILRWMCVEPGEYTAECLGHQFRLISHRLYGRRSNEWNLVINGDCDITIYGFKQAKHEAQRQLDIMLEGLYR